MQDARVLVGQPDRRDQTDTATGGGTEHVTQVHTVAHCVAVLSEPLAGFLVAHLRGPELVADERELGTTGVETGVALRGAGATDRHELLLAAARTVAAGPVTTAATGTVTAATAADATGQRAGHLGVHLGDLGVPQLDIGQTLDLREQGCGLLALLDERTVFLVGHLPLRLSGAGLQTLN